MKIGTDGVLLGAWAAIAQAPNILDIGTGTGVLALMAAQRNSRAQIDAVEIDHAAYRQATENIHATKWSSRIRVWNQSIQEYNAESAYACIISNPPYFDINRSTDISNLSRKQARTTTELSYTALLASVVRLLDADGAFYLILPFREGYEFIALAEEYQLYPAEIVEVQPREGKVANRLLIALRKEKRAIRKTQLAIRKAGKGQRDYTPAFEDLHRYFLLFL